MCCLTLAQNNAIHLAVVSLNLTEPNQHVHYWDLISSTDLCVTTPPISCWLILKWVTRVFSKPGLGKAKAEAKTSLLNRRRKQSIQTKKLVIFLKSICNGVNNVFGISHRWHTFYWFSHFIGPNSFRRLPHPLVLITFRDLTILFTFFLLPFSPGVHPFSHMLKPISDMFQRAHSKFLGQLFDKICLRLRVITHAFSGRIFMEVSSLIPQNLLSVYVEIPNFPRSVEFKQYPSVLVHISSWATQIVPFLFFP